MTRIVDAHVHLWPRDRSAEPPQEVEKLPVPVFDDDASTLLATMDRHGVTRAVLVQSPWYAGRNRYQRGLVARWPRRFAAVGCLPLRLDRTALESATHEVGRAGMLGMRIHGSTSPAIPMCS